jgi:hypothetical protein
MPRSRRKVPPLHGTPLHEEHDMKEIDANQWQEVQGGHSWSTTTHASRWHAGPGAANAPADLAGEPSSTRSEETHRAHRAARPTLACHGHLAPEPACC